MKFLFSTIIILLIFLLLGCQKTPDQVIIATHNSDVSKNQESEPGSSGVLDIQNKQSIKDFYNIPSEYFDIYNPYDNLEINFEAVVNTPDVKSIPIYSFEQQPFSQQQINRIYKALIGENKMILPNNVPTKSELEEMLVIFKKEFNEIKNKKMITDAGNDSILAYENEIKEIQKAIQAAPHNHDKEIIVDINDFEKNGNSIIGRTKINSLGDVKFEAKNNYFSFNTVPEYFHIGTNAALELEIEISREDAIAIGNDFLEDIGFSSYDLLGIYQSQNYNEYDFNDDDIDGSAYVLAYKRNVYGIPVAMTGIDSNIIDESVAYNDSYIYEYINVTVNKKGVVAVNCGGYGILKNKIHDDIQILPFQEIMKKAKEQLKYNYFEIETVETVHFLKINTIQLGYMFIKQINSEDVFLEPVWCFYGGKIDENNTLNYRPILIISAINGRNIPC